MNDRLLSLLGLARRAGRLVIGSDPVRESLEDKKAYIVIVASDISANTYKKIAYLCESFRIKCYAVNRSKEELSISLGKTCAVLAVTDKGFGDKLISLINAEQNEGGNTI